MKVLQWRKIIAWVLLTVIFAQLIPAKLFAAEGPATPETAQFEPVDTTDLVNLYTGDFSYNVPLLEIPGPEGNWPINMSYHAGIGPNTEATWVGLGWTLNPGSINRFMNGMPDDSWGGLAQSYYYHKKIKGSGVALNISYGPIGMNLSFDSQKGFGVNASLGIISAVGYFAPGADQALKNGFSLGLLNGDFTLSVGTSGVGLSADLSKSFGKEIGGSLGISAGINSKNGVSVSARGGIGARSRNGGAMSLTGVSFSSQSRGANFTVAGAGFTSQSGPSQGNFNSNSSTLSLPVGYFVGQPLSVGISWYEWEWWMDELHNDRVFGSIHQLGYLHSSTTDEYSLSTIWNPSTSDNIWSSTGYVPNPASDILIDDIYTRAKVERNLVNSILFSSEDIYQVNAQGLSGSFQPFFSNTYKIQDIDSINNTGKFSIVDQKNDGAEIKFRFLDDQGRNFTSNTTSDGENYQSLGQFGSKQIKPVLNLATGRIDGFQITAEDGKIYEFMQPTLSYSQYSVNRKKNLDDSSFVKLSSPYATSWLLTGIRGTDYVDLTGNGFSSDDYGFWVRFNYQKANGFVTWATPYNKYGPNPNNLTHEVYSCGTKEKFYLESIETSTHIAKFVTSMRIDDSPAKIPFIDLASTSTRYKEPNNVGTISVSFPLAKSFIDDYVSQNFNCAVKAYYVIEAGPPFLGIDGSDSSTFLIGDYLGPQGTNLVNATRASAIDPSYSEMDFIGTYASGGQVVIKRTITNAVLELFPKSASAFQSFARKLDSVVIHKKTLNADGTTNYTASFSNPAIESINLSYAYELCPYTPNTADYYPTGSYKSKLTLKSIQKTGLNGFAYLPPTQFAYAQNPIYGENKWDNWNGYTSAGDSSYHFNSVISSTADVDASAWSLSSILTPVGASINIGYESDIVNHISTHSNRGAWIQNWVKNMSDDAWYASTASLTKDQITLADPDTAYFQHTYNQGLRNYSIVEMDRYDMYSKVDGILTFQNEDTTFNLYNVNVSSRIAGNQYPTYQLSAPFTQKRDIPYSNFAPYTQNSITTHYYRYFIIPNTPMYAGGHRVKSVEVVDGSEIKKTLYKYIDGVSACMPSAYSKSTFPLSVDEEFVSSKFNQLGSSPGVGYAQVEVYDVDAGGNPLNGKTVYDFYTSKDVPFSVSEANDQITIKDKTGIIGKMKKISTYAVNESGNFYLVKEDAMNYLYSDLADQQVQVYKPNDPIAIQKTQSPLGLTQQKYQSKNENKPLKKIDHQRYNVFLVGTTSTTYSYDLNGGGTGAFVSNSNNIQYDAYSGKILATENQDSKGNHIISEMIPAYWKYDGMKSKNMLTQIAMTKGYVIESGNSATFNSLIGESQKRPYIKSASVNTWKDWGAGQWRQNDQLVAIKTGTAYTDFTEWLVDDPGDILATGWKRTSNITKYDRYGHPTEERGIDGNYTSSLYGYGDALPIAIATNAKNSQIAYNSFEETTGANVVTSDAKTGVQSVNQAGISGLLIAPTDATIAKFVISGWVKPQTSTTLSATGLPPQSFQSQNGWQYFEFHIAPGQTLTPSGSAGDLYDDVRIYPEGATMSTFTYDPLTWKVTAITDANNISTYYEYDGAGRLIKVYDQDKNLIKKNTYQYKRN